jgi:hypothetical protein
MSQSKLNSQDQRILIAEAGGQCEFEGCPEFIYEDMMTKQKFNFGEYAHIIGDSPDGPRGDIVLSEKYCKDRKNIMLLCPKHHKMIDTLVEKYSTEELFDMKKRHEERVRRILSIGKDRFSTVIIYAANVGCHNCVISHDEVNDTLLLDGWYPSDSRPIELGLVNSSVKDKTLEYWEIERKNLEQQFHLKVEQYVQTNRMSRFSVFAIAPMPLLVLLGTLISDKFDAHVYQLHKEPRSWTWQTDKVQPYIVKEPEKKTGKPIMVFSLSSAAIRDRVDKLYEGQDVSIWELTIPEPNNDYLRSREQLEDFRVKVRSILEDINLHTPNNEAIDVHMAMSVSCAIALGMVRNSKADRAFNLFDRNNNQDLKVMTI